MKEKKKEFNESLLKQKFSNYLVEMEPKPKFVNRFVMAFIVGGIICTIGQLFFDLYKALGMEDIQSRSLGAISLIFIGSLLTGLGVYDKIANFAGAGSVVPITGFSNAVASPAIEFKKEGVVFGTCVKMFTIAGPVIVFGITSSVFTGAIYYIYKKFGG